MMRRWFLACAVAGALAPRRAMAQSPLVDARALSGDRFEAGGVEFILADIIAPPIYSLSTREAPGFDQSRAALQSLLTSPVTIKEVMAPTRWGARRAHAFAGDVSVQQALVAEGAARVAPASDAAAFIRRLLTLEGQARLSRSGLWSPGLFRVFDAADAAPAIGDFNLIEGRVHSVGQGGGRVYLNFGADYRTDFTAGAVAPLHKRWARDGLDLLALAGTRVRVRGYVDSINGPSIDLAHPLQIEMLK